MSKKYVRLCRGLNDKGKLVEEAEVDELITTNEDWYQSLYYYNEDHYNKFKTVGTVRGIKDVVTNRIIFDFDCKEDPDIARLEARKVVERLKDIGVSSDNLIYYFTGSKGFNVEMYIDRFITPEQHKVIASKLAEGLNWDASVYNANRLIRIPGTMHQSSNLYKIPLTEDQFFHQSIGKIKSVAMSLDNVSDELTYGVQPFPKDLEPCLKAQTNVEDFETDIVQKPKGWRNCKWSLAQGNFKEGQRNDALMTIAATCRGLGYDKEQAYYICKSANKKHARKNNSTEFDKHELWNNVIEQVYSDGWQGGQYTCQTPGWLHEYCKGLGELSCEVSDQEYTLSLNEIHTKFKDFAQNFEKNVIKTGLPSLDDNCYFIINSLNGILACPGAGKTSMVLNYLQNTSKNDIPSLFFSMDMGDVLIYNKLIQKVSKKDFTKVIDVFKTDDNLEHMYKEKVKESYKNVEFCFKSALSVEQIRNVILDREEKTGKKFKLVVLDYLECIREGSISDPTAAVGIIANKLKDLANELSVCVLVLLQTQKHSTSDVSDPLLSMKNVKGSSVIEQSCSVITSMWRTGYDPETVKDDKYVSFAVLKNRFGSLWKGDFHWNGMTGNIRELTDEERMNFKEFKKVKEQIQFDRRKKKGDKWD